MRCLFTVPKLYVMALAEIAHIFGGRFAAQCHDIEVPASILGLDSICSVRKLLHHSFFLHDFLNLSGIDKNSHSSQPTVHNSVLNNLNRRHAVVQLVEALLYKAEDRGFYSRWGH
jgi:hypothetical protein